MARPLRPVGLDFLTSAPTVLRFAAAVGAPPVDVFAALSADPGTWGGWFPGLAGGAYAGAPPWGVGTTRSVRMLGGGGFRETVLAWEEPSLWVYRVDVSSYPIARALVEGWEVGPAPAGSRVEWTFAIDPTPGFAALLRPGRPLVGAVFRRAMANLGRRLAAVSR